MGTPWGCRPDTTQDPTPLYNVWDEVPRPLLPVGCRSNDPHRSKPSPFETPDVPVSPPRSRFHPPALRKDVLHCKFKPRRNGRPTGLGAGSRDLGFSTRQGPTRP